MLTSLIDRPRPFFIALVSHLGTRAFLFQIETAKEHTYIPTLFQKEVDIKELRNLK